MKIELSKNIPTEEGWYIWKVSTGIIPYLVEVRKGTSGLWILGDCGATKLDDNLGGDWSERLEIEHREKSYERKFS